VGGDGMLYTCPDGSIRNRLQGFTVRSQESQEQLAVKTLESFYENKNSLPVELNPNVLILLEASLQFHSDYMKKDS